MATKPFQAYQNETDTFTIENDFTVENRLDRISLYGSLELTKNKQGLQNAYELKRVLDAAIEVLKKADLPDHIEIKVTDSVINPFT
ncbi:MAG: hypothetical protein PHX13_11380 [Thiovulaceae bacterium]|nr:hypothetical protein [Sulfurimonadaceae bacterium]